MMDLLSTILLGVIEGVTEFLPISSTGHLLIAEHWLGQRSEMFNVVIQSGAILAVTIIYWRRLLALATGWRQPESRAYVGKLLLAFVITGGLGLTAKKLGFRLPDTLAPVAWALIIGGFWIIAAEAFVGTAAGAHRGHVAGRCRCRGGADRRRDFSRHLAIRGDDLRRHADGHQQPRRRHGIFVPRRHPDDVCGQRLGALQRMEARQRA